LILYAFAKPPSSSRRGSSPVLYYALEGGIVRPEIDYMKTGEMLYLGLRVDYTYLHPEILVSRCSVEQQKLVLNNKENREEFRVLILPGGDTLSADVAHKRSWSSIAAAGLSSPPASSPPDQPSLSAIRMCGRWFRRSSVFPTRTR
jgi:hypothetical protein